MTAQWEMAAQATDATHLELETPLAALKCGQRVKVLITFEPPGNETATLGDFRTAIGSYYRDFPNGKPMTTADYMAASREGESD